MITSRWMTYGKAWIIDKTLLYSRIQTVIGQAVKKYHSLREDLEPLLTELAAGEGGTPADRLQVTGAVLYKARIRSRDASRGKSGGYFCYLQTKEETILVTIYSKSDQSDIKIEKVQNIIDGYLKK